MWTHTETEAGDVQREDTIGKPRRETKPAGTLTLDFQDCEHVSDYCFSHSLRYFVMTSLANLK